MRNVILPLVILLFAVPTSLAAERFEFKQLETCAEEAHDPYTPDRLVAERVGDRIVVTGWAGINCGESPRSPEVLPDWGSVTLRVDFEADDAVAACRCTFKFQFLLKEPVTPGRTIYLVKNGKGAAHVVAP